MKDVYDAKGAELDDYLKSFRVVDGQKGLLVFLDGKPVGFDYVSRSGAFGLLFPKLVKSYAMEAMLAAEERKRREHAEKAKIAGRDPSTGEARSFLAAAAACEEHKNDPVGMGSYFRYAGPGMVGSALAVDEAVVHMAFFGVEEADKAGNVARMGSRRGFRII